MSLVVLGSSIGQAKDNAPLETPAGPAVQLPPFLVETSISREWNYLEIPGFEILFSCSRNMALNFAREQCRLQHLLGTVLPENLRVRIDQPGIFILCDANDHLVASQEVMSDAINSRHTGQFMPNMRLWDKGAAATFVSLQSSNCGYFLQSDYMWFLLESRTPPLPPWFVKGMMALLYRGFPNPSYSGDFAGNYLIKITWTSSEETRAILKHRDHPRTLLPMAELFANPAEIPSGDKKRLVLWQCQAALFAHWALNGKAPRREAFWRWAAQTSTDPATEEGFKTCFGISYAEMSDQLREYLPVALKKNVRLVPNDDFHPPTLETRTATRAEVGRIRSEWERLEIIYAQQHYPLLAPRYLKQARHTLQRAYAASTPPDPRLLAIMGLCEAGAGDSSKAQPLLEAAVSEKVTRPDVLYHTARLRYLGLREKAASTHSKISAAQAATVLDLLSLARTQSPPLPEVFHLYASVLADCEMVPQRSDLAVLDEGVRFFPSDLMLAYSAAVLNASRGFVAEATALVDHGLKYAKDKEYRHVFEQLREKLRPASKN